ncbi:MAG: histidinol-phosphate transaminase [Thermaerobacter sp.]|nr:histidinol-phosphate transaminase [Thermaerobacter sp.]
MIRPRAVIEQMPGYTPGRSEFQVRRETGVADIVKLASNESLWGPSPLAVAAAQQSLTAIARYPEVRPPKLLARLAAVHGFAPEETVVGNGADELLRLLAAAYLEPGLEAVMPTPSFSQYAYATRLAGGTPVPVTITPDGRMDLAAIAAALTPATRLVYLCSPNNPTGGIIRQAEWEGFLRALPDHVLVVFDAAYHEFIEDPEAADVAASIRQQAPVVMIRTFSKIYGLAGLRVGWAAGPPDVMATLQKTREPFSVNVVAEAAATAALGDQDYVSQVRIHTLAARRRFVQCVAERDLVCYPSQANFVTLATDGDPREVARRLEQQGIVVRPTTSFGLDRHIRVTLAPAPVMARFWEAWDAVAGRQPLPVDNVRKTP